MCHVWQISLCLGAYFKVFHSDILQFYELSVFHVLDIMFRHLNDFLIRIYRKFKCLPLWEIGVLCVMLKILEWLRITSNRLKTFCETSGSLSAISRSIRSGYLPWSQTAFWPFIFHFVFQLNLFSDKCF